MILKESLIYLALIDFMSYLLIDPPPPHPSKAGIALVTPLVLRSHIEIGNHLPSSDSYIIQSVGLNPQHSEQKKAALRPPSPLSQLCSLIYIHY